MSKKRVFSGVQPTGNLHLGNYLGAIRHWVKMQDDYECIYGIMDLHAITVAQNPNDLRNSIREVAAALIASGIDPNKSILFPQSAVSAHAELAWILNCHTPLGWLNRMTQFKEKAGKKRDNASLGLYGYPVLMAADILAYNATHVPVGEDQKQHLELSRDIAGAFNRAYDQEYFELPEPLIMGEATRVMSLRDGTKKMSKSDASEMSRIDLTDTQDTIAKKFRKAKSDMEEGVTYDVEKRPEASNLLTIYAALADTSRTQVEAQFASSAFSDFKKELTDLAVAKLAPLTSKMRVLMEDPESIDRYLQNGTERAHEIAQKQLAEVREIVGFPVFKESSF
ncbi:MAG: tryptophan--tRNA ligase [Rickettsiales bacterium]|nr:tryptophan--tRNA ligase [Rickettsiales bacterium]